MVNVGVVGEEFLQCVVVTSWVSVFFVIAFKVELHYFHCREVVSHVVPETNLTVSLLLTGYDTVVGLLHQHDSLFVSGDEHEHFCSEISALE